MSHTVPSSPSGGSRILFRVAAGRRRRIPVARLGEVAAAAGGAYHHSRRALLFRFLPRFRLRALLRRSRRALARVTEWYADVMREFIAEAAAVESGKARRRVDAPGEVVPAPARLAVVPPVVARAVLRCNSHYYIR